MGDFHLGAGTKDRPDRGFPLFVCTVVLFILSTLFVCARFITRYRLKSPLRSDDWSVMAAFVALVAMTITHIGAVVKGFGSHARSLSSDEMYDLLLWYFLAQLTYDLVIPLSKIAVLCLYLRLFTDRLFRYFCFGGLFVAASAGIALVFATMFQCTPVSAFWDRSITEFHCNHTLGSWLSISVLNIFIDVYILALPMREVWKLHMSTRSRVACIGVFSLGAFITMTTCIRASTLGKASHKPPTDLTWFLVTPTIWSVVEANTSIICVCLPVLKAPIWSLWSFISHTTMNTASDTSRLTQTSLPTDSICERKHERNTSVVTEYEIP